MRMEANGRPPARLLTLALPCLAWPVACEAPSRAGRLHVPHVPPSYFFPALTLTTPESIEIDRHSDTRSNTFRSEPDRTTRRPSLPAWACCLCRAIYISKMAPILDAPKLLNLLARPSPCLLATYSTHTWCFNPVQYKASPSQAS